MLRQLYDLSMRKHLNYQQNSREELPINTILPNEVNEICLQSIEHSFNTYSCTPYERDVIDFVCPKCQEEYERYWNKK